MDRSQTCFFSGHRNLPGGRKREIIEAVAEDSIRNAYRRGVRRFLCGGALGFDTLAAQLVLYWKSRAWKDAQLHLILPHRGQELRWSPANQMKYQEILEEADHVEFLQEDYTPGCMFRRNRAMVDRSSQGIFYYDGRQGGGAAWTYRYFLSRHPGREDLCDNVYPYAHESFLL